ncbi:MAG: response regulator [Deltaproteobacteria bacterium]|nr:response regulator [Deltaproteobacteria bacterium]
MNKKILIVDDDPAIRHMVTTMLAHEAFSVEQAQNGQEGLEIARSWLPDLVISDILMDTMDGWTFVKTLRSDPRLALVPVIFLSALDSREDRIRGFRLGADDYLPKPFHIDELKARIDRTFSALRRMHEHAREFATHDNDNATLEGDLSQLGLSSLLTILDMERKSGVLVVRSHRGQGRIFLRKGAVVAATLRGEASEEDAFAIYAMLAWTDGSFSFSAIDVDMDNRVNQSTTKLLMDGAQLLDERTEAARRRSASPLE